MPSKRTRGAGRRPPAYVTRWFPPSPHPRGGPPSIARRMALVVAAFMLAFMVHEAFANERGGTTNPDRVTDRPLTVQEIEDRADMRWAVNTAKQWDAEDHASCMEKMGIMGGWKGRLVYTRCLVEHSNTRFLYMLRRGCTGARAIYDICGLEVTDG